MDAEFGRHAVRPPPGFVSNYPRQVVNVQARKRTKARHLTGFEVASILMGPVGLMFYAYAAPRYFLGGGAVVFGIMALFRTRRPEVVIGIAFGLCALILGTFGPLNP